MREGGVWGLSGLGWGGMWGWPCSRTDCEEGPGKGRKQQSSPWAPATLGPQNRASKTAGSRPRDTTISQAALGKQVAGTSGSRAGQGLGSSLAWNLGFFPCWRPGQTHVPGS